VIHPLDAGSRAKSKSAGKRCEVYTHQKYPTPARTAVYSPLKQSETREQIMFWYHAVAEFGQRTRYFCIGMSGSTSFHSVRKS